LKASLAAVLEELRAAEKAQAMFYRRLAATAEAAGAEAFAQRLHDLHADEQHHLSRLTARLVELGYSPADLSGVSSVQADLTGWEAVAREREGVEVMRYEELLHGDLDPETRALAEAIVAVERMHRALLEGKWTMA
jgi:rubrerythrin